LVAEFNYQKAEKAAAEVWNEAGILALVESRASEITS
jgi:uncharacterized protein YbaA (DUF1428 family)